MPDTRPYAGKILRVDLSAGRLTDETVDPATMRKFVGGTGLGAKILYNAATGWDVTLDEAMDTGRRIVSLLRAFNVRHGITPEVEKPSLRYGSVPVDGPVKGKGIGPEWEGMLDNYYQLMGWDRSTGKPLPETLKKYGLEQQLTDLWQ